MSFGNWTRVDRIARKQHKCADCEKPILPGSKYIEWRSAGINEDTGQFWYMSNAEHLECRLRIEEETERELEELGEVPDDIFNF